MENAYWYLEYAKVFAAYLFIMFVYPSVVFHTYLRGKSRTFWFGFCICAMPVLVSTVVLMLGIVHMLNAWIIRILFYGSLIWSLSRSVRLPMTPRYMVYKLSNRTYGLRLFMLNIRMGIHAAWKKAAAFCWNAVKKDFFEVLAFAVLLAYGVLYYSWGPLQQHGYGFSDVVVHHYWTYGLQEGKIFIAGIYPEGMHCMAYAITTLFGIELYNVILFIQAANMVAFLGSVYLFAREVMGWKGSALVALGAFLVLRVDDTTLRYLLARLQIALPQEYGIYAVFATPLFLIRYLKNAGSVQFRGRKTKLYWDENLLVFLLGVSVTMSTHFYPTIMAVATCMGVVFVWPTKIFHWRRFFALADAVILAVIISFTPMMLAFAEGINFQGSIFWALNIINPPAVTASVETAQETAESQNNVTSENGTVVTETSETDMAANAEAPAKPVVQKTLMQRITEFWAKAKVRLQRNINGVYNGGYRAFYNDEWVSAFLTITKYAFLFSIAYHVLVGVLQFFSHSWKLDRGLFDGHAIVAMSTIMVMILLSSGWTDFPTLMAKDRLGSLTHIYFVILLVLPVDLAGTVLSWIFGKKLMSFLSIPAVAAVVALIVSNGYYHGFLYVLATRYNAAVDVTYSIIDTFPDHQFTIVSTTDELYQVVDYGYHEEVYTFIRSCKKRDYYIPTPYIFFFVEKKPIQYGNSLYSEGPEWLARANYNDSIGHGDHVISGEISDEKADLPLFIGSKPSNAYTQLYNREIVESKMARYLRNLAEEYSNELNVYYENDYFVCYCLKQNPDRLINFGGRTA